MKAGDNVLTSWPIWSRDYEHIEYARAVVLSKFARYVEQIPFPRITTMTDHLQSQHFTFALINLLKETFEQVQGYYLDRSTSLFETLADITAEEASIPVGGKCATLAAQVKHVAFYLDVVRQSMLNPDSSDADWGNIWQTVSNVTEPEWHAIQNELRTSYDAIIAILPQAPAWADETKVGEAIAIVAHSAYHLGEIRLALCTLRP